MKNIHSFLFLVFFPILLFGQQQKDSTRTYHSRVLESAEIDLLTSFYHQDGDNAAVTGGIGTEKLSDAATNIEVRIPLNASDVLTIDATVSAYSSASSGNLNPFTGASKSGSGDDDDDEKDGDDDNQSFNNGSPWAVASGASNADVWVSPQVSYSHASDDRNTLYSAHISFANEFDYTSFGAGVGYAKQFNEKNTEVGLKANVYFDNWNPQFPIELRSYFNNGNLDQDMFHNIPIYDALGNETLKNTVDSWQPLQNGLGIDENRNTYSASFSFSQIINKKSQFSLFSDLVYQTGWLANPMQRVYFADRENFYMGNPNAIKDYTNRKNTEVFQLADDIERLPDSRIKIPFGARYHYYINETFVLRTYYRFYYDDWGILSHTANIEIPVKLGEKYTLYPSYRFYNQSQADYFAPYEAHLSTETYYTSDFDLSKYQSNQYGIGLKYTDIFTEKHLWKFGLKNWNLNYNYYKRDTGLSAHFVSFGFDFVLE